MDIAGEPDFPTVDGYYHFLYFVIPIFSMMVLVDPRVKLTSRWIYILSIFTFIYETRLMEAKHAEKNPIVIALAPTLCGFEIIRYIRLIYYVISIWLVGTETLVRKQSNVFREKIKTQLLERLVTRCEEIDNILKEQTVKAS